MACYTPLQAWYNKEINKSGKRSLVFSDANAFEKDMPITLACGQCIGCRLERSRQWAIRCIHEASLYRDNCFITLTFSEEELQKRGNVWSLDVTEWQRFMKRLRKKFGKGIRFFHCGEYGENKGRPHYHACLFNFDFQDKKIWKIVNKNNLYISRDLEKLWTYGFSTIGDVTFESAGYVARYIMKKITGNIAKEHYQWADNETGEIFGQKPEYTTMSRRPGIGRRWLEKYKNDVYPSDFITIKGKKVKPPKFYDKILEVTRPFEFDEIKEARVLKLLKIDKKEFSVIRLKVKHQVAKIKLQKLVRNHDKE